MSKIEITFAVSDFVAAFNQTINYTYPTVSIVGELANFRVSKNKWVYFDLKDEGASVKFFGSVYQLQGPLEEGMVLTVRGVPQLHPQFGFSVTIQSISLTGEGTLKRAAELLERKLRTEGLFDESRKRVLPYPPSSIGLITSGESAAYADFVKILNERWGGIAVQLYDVQVQGEDAPNQITEAIKHFNSHADTPEVLIITRGGGSADDLQAFNTEIVTRAVATSRIPTIVAIGHEVDVSLAELAADYRASTPSNAAQALVPTREDVRNLIHSQLQQAINNYKTAIQDEKKSAREAVNLAGLQLTHDIQSQIHNLKSIKQLLLALHPETLLKRGYAIARSSGQLVKSVKGVKEGAELSVQLQDGTLLTLVKGKVQ